MTERLAFAEAFARLERQALDGASVQAAFAGILAGEWTAVQVGAFAAALRLRGETAEMIVAAAGALRAAMTVVPHTHPLVVDTCGTGGDGAHTLNVSTAAALVVSASGYVVAKHGNRSVSSRCGSADVVEALGIPLDLTPAEQGELLGTAGMAFLHATAHHPALRHAAVARRELGVRTVFNVLGPLVNPARATHQLVGVYDDRLRPIVAQALQRLGVVRAWVVRSEDGLDEISPAAVTRVSELSGGEVQERVVRPEDFGAVTTPLHGLAGGDAADNARHLQALTGGEDHPARDAVLLNAAAALHVAGFDADLPACFRRGARSRDIRRHAAAAHDLARRCASISPVSVLARIVAEKRAEVARGLPRPSAAARPVGHVPIDVVARLRRARPADPLRLVAEIKFASPSAGPLSCALSAAERAVAYAEAGAAMVSVLCDAPFFAGSYAHLAEARAALDAAGFGIPLLAKEFVVDAAQIACARAHGADAVLIIVRLLDPAAAADDPASLSALVAAARRHGLEPLVEVTDDEELARALEADGTLIGVNARDLDTLVMDAARAAGVVAQIPGDRVALHLSGLRDETAVGEVAGGRADGALLGEALMRVDDPGPLLRRLVARAAAG